MDQILIAGGARSGKSRKALERARSAGPHRLFIATAQAFDQEMIDRIGRHQIERPDFVTLEKPFDLKDGLSSDAFYDAILIDCLTLWLSNLMLAGFTDLECEARIADDLQALSLRTNALIVVSNEVGLGIVPDNALARRFRDLNGRLQQKIADSSAEVYFAMLGIIVPLHTFRAGPERVF